MLDFFRFVREHVGPAIFVVIGSFVTVGSLILDGLHAAELGLPWWFYQSLGAFIFFIAIVSLVYRLNVRIVSAQTVTAQAPAIHANAPTNLTPSTMLQSRKFVTAVKQLAPDPKGRIFIPEDVTPTLLMDFFRNNIKITAIKHVDPFIGHWMEISGPVNDVSEHGNAFSVIFKADKDGLVFMDFSREWESQIRMISRGANLHVIGKLSRVDGYSLNFIDCEIR